MKELLLIILSAMTFKKKIKRNPQPLKVYKNEIPKQEPQQRPRKRYPRPGISRSLITHSQKNPFR